MKNKTLPELLIELDRINKEIERIRNDEEYIERKTKEIFGNKKYYDREKAAADIEKILANF